MKNKEQAIQGKKFYGARYDAAFKSIFTDNIDLLEYMLSGIIGQDIKVTGFMPNEPVLDKINEKRKVLDILATTEGKKISIEVNTEHNGDYIQRRNYAYICKVYTDDVKRGNSYLNMNDIYQISFDFDYDKDLIPINEFGVISKINKEVYVDNINFYTIRVENLRSLGYNNLDGFKEFLAAIGENDPKVLKELSKKNRRIEIMTKKLNDLNNDEEFIELMSAEEENKMLLNSRIQEERIKEAKKNAIETAKRLLDKNMSIKDISSVTNLSVEDIEKIKDSKNNLDDIELMSAEEENKMLLNSRIQEEKAKSIKENNLKIAQKMLKDNLPIDTIIKYTGLSKEEIKDLQK